MKDERYQLCCLKPANAQAELHPLLPAPRLLRGRTVKTARKIATFSGVSSSALFGLWPRSCLDRTHHNKIRNMHISIVLAKRRDAFGCQCRFDDVSNHAAFIDHTVKVAAQRTVDIAPPRLRHTELVEVLIHANIAFA